MKTVIVICAMCVLFVPSVLAQTVGATAKPISDSDIQLLRSKVQAEKNDIITHTMLFNDLESAAFWPIYRDYARDQQVIGDDRWKLIKDYADHYDALDDAKADDLAKQMFSVDSKITTLREEYWPKFAKALGGKRAAKFYRVGVDDQEVVPISERLMGGL